MLNEHCLHYSEQFYTDYQNLDDLLTPRTPRVPNGETPRIPRTPAEFLAPPTSAPAPKSPLDANVSSFVPSLSPSNPHLLHDDKTKSASQTESSVSPSEPSNSDSDSFEKNDSFEIDDPNFEYVQLKLKIANLTSRRLTGDKTNATVLNNLKAHLERVKKHYFFDGKDAEEQYRVEQQKADALALHNKLRGLDVTSIQQSKSNKKRPLDIQPPKPEAVTFATDNDVFGAESAESSGMFDILEPLPVSEVTSEGVTVRLRDMATPKHWSGRTPKAFLAEAVTKADKYAAVTYEIISGTSRAKRAAVHVRWEGRKNEGWRMEDVACHDDSQAEAYIATIALHALTFPLTEGFQTGTPTSSGSQTFFRLLPAVYRDLWDELEVSRKERDDNINRLVWAKLRSIIEPKLDSTHKVRTQLSDCLSYFVDIDKN